MNKRKRKKWLKKHNKYFNESECWDLNDSIAIYVLPRLKFFRNNLHSYPGTLEDVKDWEDILDKMIIAFEYFNEGDDWWIKNPEWNPFDYPEKCTWKKNHEEEDRRYSVMQEGFELFGKWFLNLWD